MSENTTTLTGFVEFTAVKRDGSSETVRIRQLAIKEFPKFQSLQDNEIEMVAYVCGQTLPWAESLTNENHEALVAEIERVNGDFFSRWQARQLARQEKVMPGLREKLMENLLASRNLQPKSPPNAG